MLTSNQTKTVLALATVAMACFAFTAARANAGIVFAEDFESTADGAYPVLADDPAAAPDVTAAQSDGNTNGTVPTTYWVGATSGFGATRRGIVDEDHGDFTEVGDGKQAFAFRYTNSGLTTKESVIGALAAGQTYTVSFDVVLDGHNSTTPYEAGLVLFDAAASRNATQSFDNNTAAVLAKCPGSPAIGICLGWRSSVVEGILPGWSRHPPRRFSALRPIPKGVRKRPPWIATVRAYEGKRVETVRGSRR